MRRGFFSGIVTGTLLGILAGMALKPRRKPDLSNLLHMADKDVVQNRTKKMFKGMSKAVNKMVK